MAMWARVSTYEGPSGLSDEQMEEQDRQIRERILPVVQKMAGFGGVLGLADRNSGKTLSVTLWDSEESMRASEEEANRLRAQSAGIGGQEVANVERYEVTMLEMPAG